MKVALIIDLPDDTDLTKCMVGGDGKIYTSHEGEWRGSIIGDIWKDTSLRIIPDKKYYTVGDVYHNNSKVNYYDGYNQCIRDILGE